MSGWVPTPAAGWPEIAEALTVAGVAWPESAAVTDLRWWVDQRGRVPGRPTLIRRWGWTDYAVRQLLRDVARWWDPTKGERPTSRRDHQRSPADRQPTASPPPAPTRREAENRPRITSGPPADRQRTSTGALDPPSPSPSPVPSPPTPPPSGGGAPDISAEVLEVAAEVVARSGHDAVARLERRDRATLQELLGVLRELQSWPHLRRPLDALAAVAGDVAARARELVDERPDVVIGDHVSDAALEACLELVDDDGPLTDQELDHDEASRLYELLVELQAYRPPSAPDVEGWPPRQRAAELAPWMGWRAVLGEAREAALDCRLQTAIRAGRVPAMLLADARALVDRLETHRAHLPLAAR